MKAVQAKPNLTTSGAAGVAGSFYKQPSKSAQGAVATLPSNSSTSSGVPAKKPAISVRGKCVAHTEGRFRVEVSYHAELIAVFKSIPSKTYGKCVAVRLLFLQTLGAPHPVRLLPIHVENSHMFNES